MPNVSIYNYFDCRLFLKTRCEEIKKERPGFSYRQLSVKAAIRSPGFISDFIAGKKNISHAVALKIAHALELTPKEIDYFIAMLDLTQGSTDEEKKMSISQCLKLSSEQHEINAKTILIYDYYSQWYNPVIRDLTTVINVDTDFKKLAGLLDPPIRPEQARESIALLLKLGLIYKNSDGYYKRTDRFITTRSHIKTSVTHDFQTAMMQKAIDSLHRHKKEIRDISSLTIGIDESTCMHVFKMIESFRASVMSLVKTVEQPDRIVQLNIQLFPVSKCVKER